MPLAGTSGNVAVNHRGREGNGMSCGHRAMYGVPATDRKDSQASFTLSKHDSIEISIMPTLH